MVPGVPFLVSLALSTVTLGTRVDWQDSGFFIAAVKEFAVLYPPGFVLYLTLCRIWTTLFFFLDFILAVNLFSAVCAALAAGTLAVAARDLLKTRGALFRVTPEDPGALADAVGMAVGCLAASGYTFWYAGILAKDYALFYLVLTLLLWRMIRADESRKPSDLTWVAVLIGTAWQAHPSATLAGAALLAFVIAQRQVVGGKGIAWRTGLAAACALGPALLLPVMAARDTVTEFEGPASFSDLLQYLRGSRFTDMEGVFGVESSRVASVSQYLWEEMLAVGLLLGTVGLTKMATANRKLLVGFLLWVVPVVVVTTLFKIEGQHDLWLVSAWIPFWLAGAVGAYALARAAGRHGKAVTAGLAAIGLACAAAVNVPLLGRHGYDLADALGRLYLEKLEPNSILVLTSDDASAICRCKQVVHGTRSDVLVIREEDLGVDERGGPGPAYRRLLRRRPGLQPLDLPTVKAGATRGLQGGDVLLPAFLNANAVAGRPVYLERTPQSLGLLRPDFTLTPAGPFLLWEPLPGRGLDARFWEFPIEPEAVYPRIRRKRGQDVELRSGRITVRPQAYEERLLIPLLRARQHLATRLVRGSAPDQWRKSAELFESILAMRSGAASDGGVLFLLGIAYSKTGQAERAESTLKAAFPLEIPARARAEAAYLLGELCRKQGRTREATQYYALARSQPEMDPEIRQALETAPR